MSASRGWTPEHAGPFLYGAAELLIKGSPDAAELGQHWSWFDELLEGRDPGLKLVLHGTSLVDVPLRIGFLLSRLPDPKALLCASYQKLEAQRRRALFAYRYDEVHHDLESVVLLQVGLNAAVHWFKVGGQADAVHELFSWVYQQARRLWLTAVLDTGNMKRQLVEDCFAYMPVLFGDGLGAALKQAIPPIANDARLLADAGANLRRNGVEPANLAALVAGAGGDLVAALRDAHQWSQLTGREEDFPKHLQELARELGIDFAQPASPPGSERTSRLREAFVAAVPWGAALLRRLEADGCTHLRALPLEQRGNTWVLQVTLPDATRERFGLSPDLRVLAVHGQISGHDLRRALESPEGVTDVDPDLLVVAADQPTLSAKLHRLAGPWGQRVSWPFAGDRFGPLVDCLQEHLPAFDVFATRDPVRGRAFIGRRREVDAIIARLLRGAREALSRW